jgi:pimeloyl-ACP methyl ester carboxylesterase
VITEVRLAIAPRAARTYPEVRLLVLPGVGHVAQMQRPEVVARAFLGTLEVLAEHGPAAAPQDEDAAAG